MAVTKQIFEYITARIPREVKRECKRVAKESGKKPATWLGDLITTAIAEHNKKKGKK